MHEAAIEKASVEEFLIEVRGETSGWTLGHFRGKLVSREAQNKQNDGGALMYDYSMLMRQILIDRGPCWQKWRMKDIGIASGKERTL